MSQFTRPRTNALLSVFLMALIYLLGSLGACADAQAAGAQAATWRCGNAYSDRPCDGGKRIEAADTGSDEDRRASEAATLRIEQRADAMARERMQLENSPAGRGSVTIIADPRVAARKERLALQAAQRKIDREEEARRRPQTVKDKRVKVKPAS